MYPQGWENSLIAEKYQLLIYRLKNDSLCAFILNLWWIEMITELEQKNGAIKRKHEIKHGVEAVQHQCWCMNYIFQRTIYYLCMHRFSDDVMKPELNCPIIPSLDACEWRSGTMVKSFPSFYQLSITHWCPRSARAVCWTRSEMIYWLSWQCWHPLFLTCTSSHTTWRHAFNPPSHNLINGVQSSTAIRKVCSKYIPDRCMEEIFSILCAVPLWSNYPLLFDLPYLKMCFTCKT